MAKKKTMIFTNVPIKQAMEYGVKKVAIPRYEKDKEKFDKINGDYEVKVYQYRNLKHHRKLFQIANICIENGIMDIIKDHLNIYHKDEYLINDNAINSLEVIHKNQAYVLIYLCKWLFLPLEEELQPDGNKILKVSSINFREMDQLQFEEFFNKCLDYFSYKLKVDRKEWEDIL